MKRVGASFSSARMRAPVRGPTPGKLLDWLGGDDLRVGCCPKTTSRHRELVGCRHGALKAGQHSKSGMSVSVLHRCWVSHEVGSEDGVQPLHPRIEVPSTPSLVSSDCNLVFVSRAAVAGVHAVRWGAVRCGPKNGHRFGAGTTRCA